MRASEGRVRPAVMRFARLMESRLAANDHKGREGWKGCSRAYLLRRFFEEVGEYMGALDSSESHSENELADAANFLMMLHEHKRSTP